MQRTMMTPFRALSLSSSHGSKGSGNHVVICQRHPRSWIEKRVFFVTTTRVCPYCDLESYASQEGKPVPCEPGFGGFAPVEKRRPSRTQRPGGRGRGGGGGRGGAREGTPRAGGAAAPRTAVVRRTAVFKPTQPTPRGDGRPPRGSPTRQRGESSSYSVKGGPRPKHKRSPSTSSSSSSLAGTAKAAAKEEGKAGTSRSHRRGSSGGSGGSGGSDRRRPSRTTSSGKAPPSPSEGGGGGGGGGDGGATPVPGTPATEVRPLSQTVEATPKKMARSLMFTSAARKRGGGGSSFGGSISGSGVFDDAAAAAATPASSRGRVGVEPPSPSGSLFSEFSAADGVFGGTGGGGGGGAANSGNRGLPSSRGPVPVMLTLPVSLQSGGGSGGRGVGRSGTGTPGVNLPQSPISRWTAANLAGDAQRTTKSKASTGTVPADGLVPAAAAAMGAGVAPVTAEMMGVGAVGVAAAVAASDKPGKLASVAEVAVLSPSQSDAWRSAADLMAAVERAEPAEARERARPAAAVVVRLAAVLKALRPERVGESGRADDVLGKAELASGVVGEVGVLAMEEGGDGSDGGSGGGGGSAEGRVDEEAVEAAGAILSEAGHAVDSLAQTARAFAWSGKDVSELSGCAAFVTRYQTATATVLEAARKAGLFLASLATAAPGKGPRGKAEAQRLWLSVLDRHEAWMRRRDSRKGLLTAELEIPAGSVTVFRDCPLLPEGAFGETCAAEYLGLPVSATLLARPAPSPLAAAASDALGKPPTTNAATANASAAAAATLRATVTSELRTLASLVPPHPRLARIHGIETIPPRVASSPRAVKGGKKEEGGGDGEGGVVTGAGTPVLVLVGEVVDGGTLRDRVAAHAAAVAGVGEGRGEEGGGVVMEGGGGALRGGGGGGGDAAAEESGGAAEGGAGKDAYSAEKGAREDVDAQNDAAEDGAAGDGARETSARLLLRRRRVLADVAEGLAFLHERGVWHGALSAKNVLLDAEGRAKLFLFGLPETRQAVEAWRGFSNGAASATRASAAATPSDGVEGAICVQDAADATAAPPSISCLKPPSVWTPPEALSADAASAATAAAAAVAAVVDPPEEGRAAFEAERKRIGIAADAYAFGMIAWEVLTGCKPWAGVDIEDMSARVSRGERPKLSFEGTSLEGYDGFGDLVRLLWAQEPIARPAMEDVARSLGVTEPRRAAAPPAAEGSVTSTEAVLLADDEGARERSFGETDGDEPFRHAGDTNQKLLIAAVPGGSDSEEEVEVEREGEEAEAGAEAAAGKGNTQEKATEEEEEASETVVHDKPVPTAPAPSSPSPKTEKTGASSSAADETEIPASDDICGEIFTPSVGSGSDKMALDNDCTVHCSPTPEGGSEAKARVEERELRAGADGDHHGPTSSEDESGIGEGDSAVQGLSPKVVASALMTVLSSTGIANDGDEDSGGGGKMTATQQAEAVAAAMAAAVGAAAVADTSFVDHEEENDPRRQINDHAKSLPEVVETVSTTWRDLVSEDAEADTDCDEGKGADSDMFYGAISGASASGDIADYADDMSRRPWITPRGGAGSVDLETAGRDAFAVGAKAAAGSSFPAVQSRPLTNISRPLLSSSPLGSSDTPPYLHDNRVPDVDVGEHWAKRRSGDAAEMLIPPQAYMLSTQGSSRSDFESDEDGDEGYFSSSEKRSRAVFTSPIVSTAAGAKTIARDGKTETLPTFIPSPSIRPGSGYATPKAGAARTSAPSPPAHSGAIGSALPYDSAVNVRSVACTTNIHRGASIDQPPQHRTRLVAIGTSHVIESPQAGGAPARVPSPIARPGEIGSGLAPSAAVAAGVVAASAPLRRAVSSDEPHGTSRRQAGEAKAARVASPGAWPDGIGSGLAPAATVTAGVVAASVPLRRPASCDRPRSTPLRRTDGVATGTNRLVEALRAGAAPVRLRSPAARPGGIGSGLAPAAAATAGVVAASSPPRRAASSDKPHSTLRRQARKGAPDDEFKVETPKAGVRPALGRHPPVRFGKIGISIPPAEVGTAAAGAGAAGAAAASNPLHRAAKNGDQPHSARRHRTVKDATGIEHVFEAPKVETVRSRVRSPTARPGKMSSGLRPASAVSAAIVASSTPLRRTVSEDQPPHDVVPRDQADKDVVSSLSGLVSPGLSQLSTTSRGGVTVEVTPPPASSGGGHGTRRPVQGPAMTEVPVEVIPTRGVTPETPSRKGRAGTALRGLAMSFSRFGKKKKDSRVGVESFPLEER